MGALLPGMNPVATLFGLTLPAASLPVRETFESAVSLRIQRQFFVF